MQPVLLYYLAVDSELFMTPLVVLEQLVISEPNSLFPVIMKPYSLLLSSQNHTIRTCLDIVQHIYLKLQYIFSSKFHWLFSQFFCDYASFFHAFSTLCPSYFLLFIQLENCFLYKRLILLCAIVPILFHYVILI
jgi:hypothetical protein